MFKGKQEEINMVRQKLGFILAQPLTEEAIAELEALLLRLHLAWPRGKILETVFSCLMGEGRRPEYSVLPPKNPNVICEGEVCK